VEIPAPQTKLSAHFSPSPPSTHHRPTHPQIILHERPLVALQSLENRQYFPTCGSCLHVIGTCRQHLALLAEQGDRSQLVGPDEARRLQEEAALFPAAVMAPLVPCAMGCGELYCTPECREEHWARGHRLLCVGHISESEAATHPLVLYKMHAVQTNEIFLLVADVIALVLTCFEANGGDLAAALLPFRDFVQRPWWEVATNPDPRSDPVAFQHMLRSLVQEAADLLAQALFTRPGAPFAAYEGVVDGVFTPEFLACVIGMFEQNNVGIRRQSPLPSFLAEQLVPRCQEPSTRVYLQLLGKVLEDWVDAEEGEDQDEDEEEEEEEEAMHMDKEEETGRSSYGDGNGHAHHHHHEQASSPSVVSSLSPPELLEACLAKSKTSGIFSALDGTALLSLVCCMNHSCRPNCEVRWVGGLGVSSPLVAELVALEPIPAGGELFQSYVRVENTTVEERREKLKEYGFLCQCPLCTSGSR